MPGLDLSGITKLNAVPSALDYANDIAGTNAKNKLVSAQAAGASTDLQAKQRAMQLSMLSGVLNEPDPEKQRQMISNLVPIANRLNPSYQIDPNIDVPTIRALAQSQVPIEKQAEMQQALVSGMGTAPAGGGVFPNMTGATAYALPAAPGGQGTTPPAGAEAAGGETAPSATPERNESYLTSLPPSIAAHVKAIADGNENLPTGTEAKDPFWRAVSTAVFNYEPTYSASKAILRNQTEKNFTSGKGYTDKVNINSVAGHLYDLHETAPGTGATEDSVPALNFIGRNVTEGLGLPGTEGISNYRTVLHRAAPELNKFYVGGEGDATGRAKAEDDFSVDLPLNVKQNNIRTQLGLLKSKAGALQNERDRGMSDGGKEKILSPMAQALMNDIDGKPLTPAQKQLVNEHRAESNLPPKTWQDDSAESAASSQLGTKETRIDTPENVRAAFAAGRITREQAKSILQSKFGYE